MWQSDPARSTLWNLSAVPPALYPTAPIKQEFLLGGAVPIDEHLLLGGATPIRQEMLLNLQREHTYQPPKVKDIEEEWIDLDDPEGSLLPKAKEVKLRQISMRTAIYLALILAAILCLGTAGFVFGTSSGPAKKSTNGGVSGQAHP